MSKSLVAGGELEELRFGVSSGTETDDAEDGGGDGTRVYDSVEFGVPSLSASPHPPWNTSTREDGMALTVPPILVYATPGGRGGNMISLGKGCDCDMQLS
jgi:hypothetical protein